MTNAPKGATIVKEELNDEAGKKMREVKKKSSFDEFIAAVKRAEEESTTPLSGDYEVIRDVDDKLAKELQEQKRMLGWDDPTRTALVLKQAFVDKKKKKGE